MGYNPMIDEYRHSVESIRKLAPTINDATDKAAKTVARVERFLNDECSLGLAAKYPVYSEALSGDRQRRRYLCYDRVDGKFRIAIEDVLIENVSVEEEDDGPNTRDNARHVRESITAWGSCPRGERLEAFATLGWLLEHIARRAKQVSADVSGAAELVDSIMEALDSK